MRFRPKALIFTRASPEPAVGLGMESIKRDEAGPLESLIPGRGLAFLVYIFWFVGMGKGRTDCAHGSGHDARVFGWMVIWRNWKRLSLQLRNCYSLSKKRVTMRFEAIARGLSGKSVDVNGGVKLMTTAG